MRFKVRKVVAFCLPGYPESINTWLAAGRHRGREGRRVRQSNLDGRQEYRVCSGKARSKIRYIYTVKRNILGVAPKGVLQQQYWVVERYKNLLNDDYGIYFTNPRSLISPRFNICFL